MIRRGVLCLFAIMLAGTVRAEPPQLDSRSPRLPATLLEEVAKAVLEQGKISDRPGQRLRMDCDDFPLPPNGVPGAPKPLFAWSCSTDWEQLIPVVSSRIWAPTAAELLGGTTDGDAAQLKAELTEKLRRFLKVKPDPKAAAPKK